MADSMHERLVNTGPLPAAYGDESARAREHLEAEILKGLNSGESTPMTTEDWKELRAEVRRRAAGRTGEH